MSELKLQILSDTHFEAPYSLERFKERYEFPVLAGDIGIPRKGKKIKALTDYLEEVSKKYKLVLYILGNHEWYDLEYYETKKVVEKMCEKYDNVIFMDKKSFVRDRVRFVGCTLWSFVPEENVAPVTRGLNDYSRIKIKEEGGNVRKLKVSDTVKFFHDERKFIENEIAIAKERNEKVVVITHHAPFMDGSASPKHKGSKVSCAFSSDLKEMIKDPVICWVWGHTHFCAKVVINGVPCVSNQLGYFTMGERTGFDEKYVIKLMF